MRLRVFWLAGLVLTWPMGVPAQEGGDPSRLYGRVTTMDGSVFEGFIRWAGNEAGWFDILHADKPIPDRNRRDAERLGWEPGERERRIEVLGIGISWDEEGPGIGGSAQSGVRLGHISSLEPVGSNRARVVLKSGEELVFDGGGDIGSAVGEIIVDDPGAGQVELDWGDIRSVDFLGGPGARSRWGQRLYGTLGTRDGLELTGYIVWDMDELFETDVLDGEDGGGDREIQFGRIRSIEPAGSSAARVELDDGEVLILEGSNDVNDENRDILVADPSFGEARVEWDELERVEFETAPASPAFGVFDGGRRIRGTVRTRGESHAGAIRWDNDEEFTWEVLDGRLPGGVDLDIEFGAIRRIERAADDRSRVTLRDGRTFDLAESNDVNGGNKGIYVERADGTLILVPWERFQAAEFEP